MTQDPITLYKLIVLYMLDRVNFPLTKAQVGDFILEKEYTTFLTLQQAISELTDADMVRAKSIRNRTHLEITEEGRQTLGFFENRISSSIREEIDKYFKENEYELKNEVSVLSNYYKSTTGEYEANMIIREKNINLVNLTMSVPTEELAASICDKWETANQDVYNLLVEKLF
ncbi:MAG: DUF4364 family protein [Lachnospiraceae bacterium]|jgi:hypothetical protein|nr:DUF4364 family protein [Lachnospiraceae bacterium]